MEGHVFSQLFLFRRCVSIGGEGMERDLLLFVYVYVYVYVLFCCLTGVLFTFFRSFSIIFEEVRKPSVVDRYIKKGLLEKKSRLKLEKKK